METKLIEIKNFINWFPLYESQYRRHKSSNLLNMNEETITLNSVYLFVFNKFFYLNFTIKILLLNYI